MDRNSPDQNDSHDPNDTRMAWLANMTGAWPPGSELDEWVHATVQAHDEDRDEAARRIRECIRVAEALRASGGAATEFLDLSDLGLTTLPDLPRAVEHVNLDLNRFMALPPNLPPWLVQLSVSQCHLMELTELPFPNLRSFTASYNLLDSLPAMPSSLRQLDVSHNSIREINLQGVEELVTLNASHNRLQAYPEIHSPRIADINLARNELIEMPAIDHRGLRNLNLSDNRLMHLDASILRAMAPDGNLRLFGNDDLDDATRDALDPRNTVTDLSLAPNVFWDRPLLFDYDSDDTLEPVSPGGSIDTEMAGPRPLPGLDTIMRPAARPIIDAVSRWIPGDDESLAVWSEVENDDVAQEYSRFLDKISSTRDFSRPAFTEAIREDLRQAAQHENLRERLFLVAYDSSTTCVDRIALVWSQMQNARVAADAERGEYDDRAGELVDKARIMFRTDKLAEMSGTRALVVKKRREDEFDQVNRGREQDEAYLENRRSYTSVDSTEVDLGYLVKTAPYLDLGEVAQRMEYEHESRTQGVDFEAVAREVADAETPEAMLMFLATGCGAWTELVKRADPAGYAEAEQSRNEAAVDVDVIKERTDAMLAEMGFGDIDDPILREMAGSRMGEMVRRQLDYEHMGPLTRALLQSRGIEL